MYRIPCCHFYCNGHIGYAISYDPDLAVPVMCDFCARILDAFCVVVLGRDRLIDEDWVKERLRQWLDGERDDW